MTAEPQLLLEQPAARPALHQVVNLRSGHPRAGEAPDVDQLPPPLSRRPITSPDQLPASVRELIGGLCGGDLARVDRVGAAWVIYNSAALRELAREARRRERHRIRQKLARHGVSMPTAVPALAEPERPRGRSAFHPLAGRPRALQRVPERVPERRPEAEHASPLGPWPAPTKGRALAPEPAAAPAYAGPPVVLGRGQAEDDDWYDPATGMLVMPMAVAVQAREDMHAKREACHAQALLEHAELEAYAEARERARQAQPCRPERLARKPRGKLASISKLVASTSREHARFGVPLNQVQLRHQVVLERPALKAMGQLRTAGDAGRLTKVLGALDVLRTEGPGHPSLRTKRYAGAEGIGADGQPIYQSNAENGTPGAWRIRWQWGEPDDAGRARIRVLDVHAHSSTGWGHGGAG